MKVKKKIRASRDCRILHTVVEQSMKVKKAQFDVLLKKLLKTLPLEREKIKTKGKGGPKTPILEKQQ